MGNRFDDALEYYLANEGGDVNHEDDVGGLTSRGLSSVFNRDLGDVTKLSDKEVRDIYRDRYWNKNFDRLNSDRVAIKVFDVATNAGFDDGSRVLQEAINLSGGDVDVDGVAGSRTVKAANSVDPDVLLENLAVANWDMYQEKMAINPRNKAFARGWKRRAYRVPETKQLGVM